MQCSNYVCFNGAKCASVVLWRKVLIIPTQPLISSHTAEMIADVIQIASLGHLPARPGHKDTSKAAAASTRSIAPHVLSETSEPKVDLRESLWQQQPFLRALR